MTFEQYLEKTERNLRIMSRTANGIVDTSASRTKADYMKIESGEEASKTAFSNIRTALAFAYEQKNRKFLSSDEIKKFITDVALKVNEGIVKEGCLFRQGSDSDSLPYARIADIDRIYDWFCGQLFDRIETGYADHIETACFAEYLINPVGHFFSDGCSKVSMAISAYILMREDMPLPAYRGREEYYDVLERSNRRIPSVNEVVDPKAYSVFLEYFRSLF